MLFFPLPSLARSLLLGLFLEAPLFLFWCFVFFIKNGAEAGQEKKRKKESLSLFVQPSPSSSSKSPKTHHRRGLLEVDRGLSRRASPVIGFEGLF